MLVSRHVNLLYFLYVNYMEEYLETTFFQIYQKYRNHRRIYSSRHVYMRHNASGQR